MTDTALLPCPFCGGKAKIVEGEESAYVQCVEMKMHRALWFDGDNAAANEVAEQWNRRASPSQRPAVEEALKSFAIYTVEDDEDIIRLSTDGIQVACWRANSPEGIAVLKLDVLVQAALASIAPQGGDGDAK